jgi:hypothetical protein
LTSLFTSVSYSPGYGDAEKYVQQRIDYAKRVKDTASNNYDWPEIQKKGEEVYRQQLLDEARGQVPINEAMKNEAKKFGFAYFDLTERPFNEHVRVVMGSL